MNFSEAFRTLKVELSCAMGPFEWVIVWWEFRLLHANLAAFVHASGPGQVQEARPRSLVAIKQLGPKAHQKIRFIEPKGLIKRGDMLNIYEKLETFKISSTWEIWFNGWLEHDQGVILHPFRGIYVFWKKLLCAVSKHFLRYSSRCQNISQTSPNMFENSSFSNLSSPFFIICRHISSM